MKEKITPEQENVIDTIHNLIMFQFTKDEDYLNAIPDIDSPEFHDWIYFWTYQRYEYEIGVIHAVVYLNGKHFEYTCYTDFMGSVRVNEINDSEVETKIIEFGGEIWDDFELYDSDVEIDPEAATSLNKLYKNNKAIKQKGDYTDLPF